MIEEIQQDIFYDIAHQHLRATLIERDANAQFSWPAWNAFADANLFRQIKPDKEISPTALFPYYNIARGSLDLPFTSSLAAHGFVSLALLKTFAAPELLQALWEPMNQGTEIGAICNSELGTSLQLKKMKAELEVNTSGEFSFQFNKPCITNGSIGTVLITSIWRSSASGKKGLELYCLRPDEVEQRNICLELTGFRTGDTGALCARRPQADLLQRRFAGPDFSLHALKYCFFIERLIIAMMAAGIAHGVEEYLLEQIKDRGFDFQEDSKQYLQEKLLQVHIVRKQMSSLIDTVLRRGFEKADQSASELSILKLMISENLRTAIFAAIEFIGHRGLTRSIILHKVLRDIEMCSFFGGTRELQKSTLFKLMLNNKNAS